MLCEVRVVTMMLIETSLTGPRNCTPSDLRAVLRLQPSNAEAIAEIHALCPQVEEAHTPVSQPVASSSSCSPSSSSSSAHPSSSASSSSSSSSQSAVNANSWIPAPRTHKPLPFPRGATDDRKLKIAPIPITVEIPVDLASFMETATAAVNNKMQSPGQGQGQDRSGSKTLKDEMAGPTVSQTFSYPCWERYMVSRV